MPRKKHKASKKRPDTANHILLKYVSSYILKQKAPQNSPVAPSYPPPGHSLHPRKYCVPLSR